MEHRPLKRRRRRTSSINNNDSQRLKRQKVLASVLGELQRTAEEVRCALNAATCLSVEERMRGALIIDHVEMMSRMMERDYGVRVGDGEMGEDDGEEMEEDGDGDGDGNEDEDNAGDVTEEVAVGEPELPVIKGRSEFVVENDENEGSGGKEGGDEDEDGYGDGEKEYKDPGSPWIKRGVSFSAGAICTACTESEGS